MKNGVFYLLLGYTIITFTSHASELDIPLCKYERQRGILKFTCHHSPEVSTAEQNQYISINRISKYTQSLTMEAFEIAWKWQIDKPSYFREFPKLTDLKVVGPMVFSENLSKQQLKRELFNVSTLESLFLSTNKFNDEDHMWTLPASLKRFVVIGNDYSSYSLSDCPKLEELVFQHTNLISLPKLSVPPPPLKIVDFRHNPVLEIKTENIAYFCNANRIAFDATNLETADTYCECVKMKQWTKEVLQVSELELFNKSLTCYYSSKICQDSSLEKAREKRENCITQMASLQQKSNNYKTQSMNGLVFYLTVVVVICTVSGLFSFIFYTAYNLNKRHQELAAEEKNEEDEYESESEYEMHETEE